LADIYISNPYKCKYNFQSPWVLAGLTLKNALGSFLLARYTLVYI